MVGNKVLLLYLSYIYCKIISVVIVVIILTLASLSLSLLLPHSLPARFALVHLGLFIIIFGIGIYYV